MSTPLRALAVAGALLSLLAGPAAGAAPAHSTSTAPAASVPDSSAGAADMFGIAGLASPDPTVHTSSDPLDCTADNPVATALGASDVPRTGPLTFDEYGMGTLSGDEYRARGVVFTSPVELTSDGSNPCSPVLTGLPTFEGPVSGRFVIPGTDTPTTVSRISMNVGYINQVDSTQISLFGTDGKLIAMRRAQSLGINAVSIQIDGIASFTVESISREDGGFAVDNLDFGDAIPGITPTRMASFGDSYTSGEGLKDGLDYDCATDLFLRSYYEGTTLPTAGSTSYTTPYWSSKVNCVTTTGSHTMPSDLYKRKAAVYENKCHRSPRAYAVQIRKDLGISAGNAIFTACSGAVTRNLGFVAKPSVQWKQSPPGIFGAHTQKTDVSTFVGDGGEPNFVTVGIGGNDAGFSDVVLKCLGGGTCNDETDWAQGVVDTIHGTVRDRLIETFEGMRAQYPDATIAAFGYPSVIGDPSKGCGSLEWWFGLGINEQEREW
ncbi:MAG: hypothetical protein AAGC46_20345, partial [Solirubrobacteraceae bacterium]